MLHFYHMEDLTRQADQKIREWAARKDKLVVAIDGYTGVGKTTLLDNLTKQNPDIVPVHWDDFLMSSREWEEKLKNDAGRAEVCPTSHTDHDRIEKVITDFRNQNGIYQTNIFNPQTGEVDTPIEYDFSKKILVMDGVFVFHPKLLNHLWDKRIYVDGDTDEIDRRRVAREKARWGEKYFPETHPDSHFRKLTIALKKYRAEHKPEEKADLVLHNTDE